MRAVVLSILITLGFWANEYSQGSTDKCSGLPVTYTTGNTEQDAALYRSEWEIVSIFPSFDAVQQIGWIAVVDIFDTSDPRMKTYVTTDKKWGWAQVYRDGAWELQSEFEKFVCSLPREYR